MQSIFMCGCFRSNTSISAYILDCHPEIMMANELCAFDTTESSMNRRLRWCEKYRFSNTTKPHKRYLRDSGDNVSLNYERFYDNISQRERPIDFPTFVKWIKECKSPTITLMGEKLPAFLNDKPVHEHVKVFTKFETIGPVKVICCIRDGRDVLTSQIKQWHNTIPERRVLSKWIRPDLESCLTGVMTWYHYMVSWTTWKKKAKVPWFELHYGRLTHDRDSEAGRLAEFLGVDQQYMKRLFQEYFKPATEWKVQRPFLNQRIPSRWRKMLELYDFEA